MAKVSCKREDVIVIGPDAYAFSDIKIAGGYISVKADDGSRINNATFRADNLYACMFFDDIRIIALIIKEGEPYTIKLFFKNKEGYERGLEILRSGIAGGGTIFSRQDARIGSYAKKIVKLMRNGMNPQIADAVNEGDIARCPECGMQCDPSQQYCFECGAELAGETDYR